MSDSPIARTTVTNVAPGTVDGQTLIWDGGVPQWQPTDDLMVVGGNVGIGTATPAAPLQIGEKYALGWSPFASTTTIFNGAPTVNNTSLSLVASSLGTASILLGNELTQSLGVFEYDTPNNEVRVGATAAGGDVAIIAGSGVEHMRITATGNVGIGTTNPDTSGAKLTVVTDSFTALNLQSTTAACRIDFSDSGTGGINKTLIGSAGTALQFLTGGAERMRIDASGYVKINKTSGTDAWLDIDGVSGPACIVTRRTQTTQITHLNFFNGNGAVGSIQTTGTTTAFNTSSDEALKKNVVDSPSAVPIIDAIQIRSFDWKVDDKHQTHGVIAQELNTAYPYAVSPANDEAEFWSVDLSKLVPVLVKAIQELTARVEALEA